MKASKQALRHKKRGCRGTLLRSAILLDLREYCGLEPAVAELGAGSVHEHGHPLAIPARKRGVGVHVELVERDAEGGERARHLLAQMAARAPVEAQRPLSR